MKDDHRRHEMGQPLKDFAFQQLIIPGKPVPLDHMGQNLQYDLLRDEISHYTEQDDQDGHHDVREGRHCTGSILNCRSQSLIHSIMHHLQHVFSLSYSLIKTHILILPQKSTH